ncbi:MAG TPA: MFS transporter [Acidimicrobiales bacterium]|jgi:MFS family permease|nr:MFS transporter [Acidimicrobiales bacterium]
MAHNTQPGGEGVAVLGAGEPPVTGQRHVFWASYFGWLLDGFDTTVYAFVLVPALKYLLPASGVSTAETSFFGLTFFAVFLAGWGSSFLVGFLADRFGRLRTLGLSILLYALGTLASGLAHNLTEFGIARLVTGFGLGAEWFIGGTGVAESFPEDKRDIWAGRFHSAWYVGFILAAAIVPFLAPVIGWRAVFFIGVAPALLLFYIRFSATEPYRWSGAKQRLGAQMTMLRSARTILNRTYRRQTLLLAFIMIPIIAGLYGGTLFVPTALTDLDKVAHTGLSTSYLVAVGGSIIAALTIAGCLVMPYLARWIGRRGALAIFLAFMAVGLVVVFEVEFKASNMGGFLAALTLLGIGGADFSVFSLWLPEIYPTEARAGGFGFVTTIGRYAGAALTFGIGAMNAAIGLGNSLAVTAAFFIIALLLLPFTTETKGQRMPE